MPDEPWYKINTIESKKLFENNELPDILQVQARLVKAQHLLAKEFEFKKKYPKHEAATNT